MRDKQTWFKFQLTALQEGKLKGASLPEPLLSHLLNGDDTHHIKCLAHNWQIQQLLLLSSLLFPLPSIISCKPGVSSQMCQEYYGEVTPEDRLTREPSHAQHSSGCFVSAVSSIWFLFNPRISAFSQKAVDFFVLSINILDKTSF